MTSKGCVTCIFLIRSYVACRVIFGVCGQIYVLDLLDLLGLLSLLGTWVPVFPQARLLSKCKFVVQPPRWYERLSRMHQSQILGL